MLPPSRRHLEPLRIALAVVAAVVLFAAPRAAAGAFGDGFAPDAASPPFAFRPGGFHLDGASLLASADGSASPARFRIDATGTLLLPTDRERLRRDVEAATVSVPGSRHRDKSWLVAGSFSLAFLGLEYLAFWSSSKINDDFEFANEGWFDPDTYTGGADKGSHIVGGYIAGRILEEALLWGGSRPEKAQLISAAMIAVTGTLIEVGDAYHGYGFGWQDALITAGGGVVGSLLAHYKLDDTITMRYGMVGVDYPNDPEVVLYDPNHYSGEMYTLDLRMAGLLPRMGRKPGWARFFLVSATYGSKGYPWVEPEYRQRRVGVEVAVDWYEVGLAFGIPKHTWWGAPTLAFLRYFRIPFTGIGVQYELNSRRWMGPNSFYSYDR